MNNCNQDTLMCCIVNYSLFPSILFYNHRHKNHRYRHTSLRGRYHDRFQSTARPRTQRYRLCSFRSLYHNLGNFRHTYRCILHHSNRFHILCIHLMLDGTQGSLHQDKSHYILSPTFLRHTQYSPRCSCCSSCNPEDMIRYMTSPKTRSCKINIHWSLRHR